MLSCTVLGTLSLSTARPSPETAPKREHRGWQGADRQLGTVWWEWRSEGTIQEPPRIDSEPVNIGDLFLNINTEEGGNDQMWLRRSGPGKVPVWDDITNQWDTIKAMKDVTGSILHPLDRDRVLTIRDAKGNKPSWITTASHKSKMNQK
jgi:hypothetical protein